MGQEDKKDFFPPSCVKDWSRELDGWQNCKVGLVKYFKEEFIVNLNVFIFKE